MKIALCLSGYFNSLKDGTSSGIDGYNYIKKHILSKREEGHEVDVFFHNWEPALEPILNTLYHPVNYIVESQIDFDLIAHNHQVSRKHLDGNGELGTWTINSTEGGGYVGPERILSQYYSVQKSFELMRSHEISAGFRYDCVIKSRFDLGRVNRDTSGPGKANPWPCQCIDFNPSYDMSKFYQVYWDLFNEGPADMWFYSNSENMECFTTLYDQALNIYLQVGSEYSQAVTTGWPESHAGNYRTNEIEKPKSEQSTLSLIHI